MIEFTSGSATALNRTAVALLKPEGFRSRPDAPALLQLARWGLTNLDLTGPWAKERETMESLLVRLEQRAKHDPAGAVRALAVGVDESQPLHPSRLGPTKEDAAMTLLESLYAMIEEQRILSNPRD
jgi:hypothetical protein